MILHSRKTILSYNQIKTVCHDVASRQLLKEFTHAEYFSIKKSLEINPFLALLVARFPPIEQRVFNNLFKKAQKNYEHHDFINEIHSPLLQTTRKTCLSFLEATYRDTQTPVHEQLITLELKQRASLAKQLKLRLTECIEECLRDPFICSSIFNNDYQGAEQVFLYLDFIESRLIHDGDVGAKSLWLITEWIISEKNIEKSIDKKKILLTSLYESAIIYRFEPIKIFEPYDFSCLPGLTQRLLDEVSAFDESLLGEREEKLEEIYFGLMIDKFISLQKTPTDFFKQIIFNISINLGAKLIEKKLFQLTCDNVLLFKDVFIQDRRQYILSSFNSLSSEESLLHRRKKLSLLNNYLESESQLKTDEQLSVILEKECDLFLAKYTEITFENFDTLPLLLQSNLDLFTMNDLSESILSFPEDDQEYSIDLIKNGLKDYFSKGHLSLLTSLIDIDFFIQDSLNSINQHFVFNSSIFEMHLSGWRSKIYIQNLSIKELPFIYALSDHPKIFPQIIKEKLLTHEQICCCEEILLDAYDVLKFEINASFGVLNLLEQHLIEKALSAGYVELARAIFTEHEGLFYDFSVIKKMVGAYYHSADDQIEQMIDSLHLKEPHFLNKLLNLALIYDNSTIANLVFSKIAIDQRTTVLSVINSSQFNQTSLFENFLQENKPQLMMWYLGSHNGEIRWDKLLAHLNNNPHSIDSCVKVIFTHHGINHAIKMNNSDSYQRSLPILLASELKNDPLMVWLLSEGCELNQNAFLKILSNIHTSMHPSTSLLIEFIKRVPASLSFHSSMKFLNENIDSLNTQTKELIHVIYETSTTNLPRLIQSEIHEESYQLMISYLCALIKNNLSTTSDLQRNDYQEIYNFLELKGFYHLTDILISSHEFHVSNLIGLLKRLKNIELILEKDPRSKQSCLQLIITKMKSFLSTEKTEGIIVDLLESMPNLNLDRKISIETTSWPLFSYLYDLCQMKTIMNVLINSSILNNTASDSLIVYSHAALKETLQKESLDTYFKLILLFNQAQREAILEDVEILNVLIDRIIDSNEPQLFDKELSSLPSIALKQKLSFSRLLQKRSVQEIEQLLSFVRRAESMTSSFDQLIADILSQKNQKPSILSRFNNLNKFFSKEPQIHEKSQSTSLQKNFHR